MGAALWRPARLVARVRRLGGVVSGRTGCVVCGCVTGMSGRSGPGFDGLSGGAGAAAGQDGSHGDE
ncbi:MAG: hypothetical protein M3Q27_03160 [Actinomycetota bacterium]|nr:hypothetical protein [Actinomycetota bacterium]